jgi:anti-sigma regulatory factor (Ser/Thr protein kinase)
MDRSATLVIRADLGEIPRVSALLDRVMGACGFPHDAILDLQLAVEEAVANTIQHGYRGAAGEIALTISATDRTAKVRIVDNASPFSPLSLPDPDRESGISERQIGGLGIYLIRQVVDDVSYRHAGGKNILTLVKRKRGS